MAASLASKVREWVCTLSRGLLAFCTTQSDYIYSFTLSRGLLFTFPEVGVKWKALTNSANKCVFTRGSTVGRTLHLGWSGGYPGHRHPGSGFFSGMVLTARAILQGFWKDQISTSRKTANILQMCKLPLNTMHIFHQEQPSLLQILSEPAHGEVSKV